LGTVFKTLTERKKTYYISEIMGNVTPFHCLSHGMTSNSIDSNNVKYMKKWKTVPPHIKQAYIYFGGGVELLKIN
jgi:hypothetical protein